MTTILWFEFFLGMVAGFCVGAAAVSLYWRRQFIMFARAVTRMR